MGLSSRLKSAPFSQSPTDHDCLHALVSWVPIICHRQGGRGARSPIPARFISRQFGRASARRLARVLPRIELHLWLWYGLACLLVSLLQGFLFLLFELSLLFGFLIPASPCGRVQLHLRRGSADVKTHKQRRRDHRGEAPN